MTTDLDCIRLDPISDTLVHTQSSYPSPLSMPAQSSDHRGSKCPECCANPSSTSHSSQSYDYQLSGRFMSEERHPWNIRGDSGREIVDGDDHDPKSGSMENGNREQSRQSVAEDEEEGDGDDEETDVDELVGAHDDAESLSSQNGKDVHKRWASTRLFIAFVTFGLLNNVLYVIILSAALDLVPSTTPKGIVAFFNIFPALLAKVFWPLLSTGTIRYRRRVGFCTFMSWLGIVIIAMSSSVNLRLCGIGLASFSSGLGELTFLQLTTRLPTSSSSRTALGAWSSGTGLAGVAGAAIWWVLRGLGVKGGLGISSFLPLFFPITYTFILPSMSLLLSSTSSAQYKPIPADASSHTNVDNEDDESATSIRPESVDPETGGPPLKEILPEVRLSTADKLALLKPLVVPYMLPLCVVYIEEYLINSGVAPTLVFNPPTEGFWAWFFKSPRDFYPFWSLTYQSFVFLSRSSLSLGLPPLPRRLLPIPVLAQFGVLSLLTLQAKSFIFLSPFNPSLTTITDGSVWPGTNRAITCVFLLICLEGLCGGCAYVNTFFQVGREGNVNDERSIKGKAEKEFRIGAVGAADSCGILFASLISMPVEISLCDSQVSQGRTLCRDL